MDLVPLACEDVAPYDGCITLFFFLFMTEGGG